jgi:tetratricopeptide (TPR) repeat protein
MADFSIEATLAEIRDSASRGRWAEAMRLADEALAKSLHPELMTTAGMLHFCNGDYPGARQRFSELLSMDAKDNQARLIMVLIDWISGTSEKSAAHRNLLETDWRSNAEFQGYLARGLEGSVSIDHALKGWNNPAEKTWVYFISGLVCSKEGKSEEAEKLLQEAVLSGDPDSWEFFLSRASLEDLRKKRRTIFRTSNQWTEYAAQVEQFETISRRSLELKKKKKEELAPLLPCLADTQVPLEEKRSVLDKAFKIDPENHGILATLAYYTTAMGIWPDALNYLRMFLASEGRQNAARMSLGLLEAGILHYQGKELEAQVSLRDYGGRTHDPWFLAICEYLMERQTEESLKRQASEDPENMITAFTVAGFWAEGSKDNKNALRFYREALGTFLDDWPEYDFVRERMKHLRGSGG